MSPTLSFLFALALFYPAGTFLLTPIRDPDIWWHLKTGEYILKNFRFPVPDPFSFTSSEPWQIYAWLPEICFSWVHSLFGFWGLKIFFALFLLLFSLKFWSFLFKINPRPTLCFVFTLLTAMMFMSVSGPRPQFFSYIFLGWLIITLVEKELPPRALTYSRSLPRTAMRGSPPIPDAEASATSGGYPKGEMQRGMKGLWFLPGLFLLWANCHISFPLGLAFFGIYVLSKLWPHLLDTPVIELFEKQFSAASLYREFVPESKNIRFLYLWLACFLACLVNPYGLKIFLEFIPIAQDWSWIHIGEMQPLNSRSPLCNLFFVFLSLCILWLTLFGKKMRLWEWLLVLISLLMPFFAVKFLPVPFLVALPVLYAQGNFERFTHAQKFRFPPAFNFLLLLIALGGLVFTALKERAHVSSLFPEAATNFLKQQLPRIQGNIANHYNQGGYLIWALWPEKKVFIDNRAPLYSEHFLKYDYGALMLEEEAKPWREVLDHYKIELILWPNSHPLVHVLDAAGWQKIYSDKNFSIFERPSY